MRVEICQKKQVKTKKRQGCRVLERRIRSLEVGFETGCIVETPDDFAVNIGDCQALQANLLMH